MQRWMVSTSVSLTRILSWTSCRIVRKEQQPACRIAAQSFSLPCIKHLILADVSTCVQIYRKFTVVAKHRVTFMTLAARAGKVYVTE